MKDSFIELTIQNFFKIAFAVLLVGLFIYIMLPFMISIILGGILAMALYPIFEFIMRRGISRRASLIIFSFLFAITSFVPVIGFFIRGSRMLTNKIHGTNLNDLTVKLTSSVQRFIDHICSIYDLDKEFVQQKFVAAVTFTGTFLAKTFSEFIADLPLVLMTGLITVLAVYFFLNESVRIRKMFDRYSYFSKANSERFVKMCMVSCRQVFFANILTGIVQATIVSIGALIFHTGDFFLIFYITFVLSFIPIIGAAPVAVVLAIFSFMDNRTGAGIGLLGFAVVSGLADNIIRPYLGSRGEVEVHPFIGLMAVIGGVIMFGLPGLFIGPLIASLIFGALPIISDEYLP